MAEERIRLASACLETLRMLLIGAAVLTLLQPELLQIEKDVPPSEIAVLYDDSASMTTRDMPLEQAALIERHAIEG